MFALFLLSALAVLTQATLPEKPNYYVRFPALVRVPGTITEAKAEGMVAWDQPASGSNCDNGGGGNIYYYPSGHDWYREWGMLPGYIYTEYDGTIAGIIVASKKKYIVQRPDWDLGGPWENAETELQGHIQWFQDPTTICAKTAPADIGLGLYIKVVLCRDQDTGCQTGVRKIPETVADQDDINKQMNLKGWLKHLCFEGMGDHYIYREACKHTYGFQLVVNPHSGSTTGFVNTMQMNSTALTEWVKSQGGKDWSDMIPRNRNDVKPYGITPAVEFVSTYVARGVIVNDDIVPIGKVCGEVGRLGYDAGNPTGTDPDCELCKNTPAMTTHIYRDDNGMPGLDYAGCILPNPGSTDSLAPSGKWKKCSGCNYVVPRLAQIGVWEGRKVDLCELEDEIWAKNCAFDSYFTGDASIKYNCPRNWTDPEFDTPCGHQCTGVKKKHNVKCAKKYEVECGNDAECQWELKFDCSNFDNKPKVCNAQSACVLEKKTKKCVRLDNCGINSNGQKCTAKCCKERVDQGCFWHKNEKTCVNAQGLDVDCTILGPKRCVDTYQDYCDFDVDTKACTDKPGRHSTY